MPILESASSSLSERRLKQAQHRSSTLPAASSSAHTRHMKALLTAQQISKTDRNDARGIAQMMRVGLFKPVHVKTLIAQEQRMLLTSRKLLDVESDLRGTL